jgi:hypothetical protein
MSSVISSSTSHNPIEFYPSDQSSQVILFRNLLNGSSKYVTPDDDCYTIGSGLNNQLIALRV